MVFVVLCPGASEGSPAVVLILKRLRRRGHGLKSHSTDWEKPGIKPATPGLQDIGLFLTPRRLFFPTESNSHSVCKLYIFSILFVIKGLESYCPSDNLRGSQF